MRSRVSDPQRGSGSDYLGPWRRKRHSVDQLRITGVSSSAREAIKIKEITQGGNKNKGDHPGLCGPQEGWTFHRPELLLDPHSSPWGNIYPSGRKEEQGRKNSISDVYLSKRNWVETEDDRWVRKTSLQIRVLRLSSSYYLYKDECAKRPWKNPNN